MATRDFTKPNASIVSNENTYTDLDMNFIAHPISGDITTKKDSDAIKRAVRNIVLTNHYERPFKPNFGVNLRSMLFELNNPTTGRRMREMIAKEIHILEPRVKVSEIDLYQRNNSLDIGIHYTIRGSSQQKQKLDLTISRVR